MNTEHDPNDFEELYSGCYWQNNPVEWSVLFDFLKEHKENSHHCIVTLNNKTAPSSKRGIKKNKKIIEEDYSHVLAKWCALNVIYIVREDHEGDSGDEDGYGRDDGDYSVAIVNESGDYILPFTDANDRGAQWKALEYEIEPYTYTYNLLQEFNNNQLLTNLKPLKFYH